MLRIQRRSLVTFVPCFSYNLRRPSRKPTLADKERIEYKYLMNQYRSRLVKDYWQEQTQIENKYIDDFLERERLKQKKNLLFKRNQTVIQTYIATQQHQAQQKRQQAKEERVKKYILEKDIKRMNRQQILAMLTEESKSWIDLSNIDQQLVGQSILPNTVTDEITYYHDLVDQAILYENAEFEEIDALNDPQKLLSWKNRLAIPIYQRIVSLIKHLRHDNPVSKIEFEWNVCRSAILRDRHLSDQELADQLAKIDGAFESLIQITIDEQNPATRLGQLNKQLLWLYNLLTLWDRYVVIIKMDDSTARGLVEEEENEYDLFDRTESQGEMSNIKQSKVMENEMDQQETYTSADERHTESEDEIDIEKMVREKEQQEEQQKRSQAKSSATQEFKPESDGKKDQGFDSKFVQSPLQMYSQTIEQLLANAEKLDSRTKFEDLYGKRATNKVLYSTKLDYTTLDGRHLFGEIDLEQLFSKEVLEDSENGPYLERKSLAEIEEHFDQMKAYYEHKKNDKIDDLQNPDVRKLNTSVFAETYKKLLKGLQVPPEYQTQLQEALKLIDLVGELKINEADLLLRLWRQLK